MSTSMCGQNNQGLEGDSSYSMRASSYGYGTQANVLVNEIVNNDTARDAQVLLQRL